MDKPLAWMSRTVRTPPFSAAARIAAGVMLRRLQKGEKLGMPESRPMPSIGRRCHELRIPDQGVTWRIIYRIDADAILILDAFSKKTRQTPQSVIDRCRKRLSNYDGRA